MTDIGDWGDILDNFGGEGGFDIKDVGDWIDLAGDVYDKVQPPSGGGTVGIGPDMDPGPPPDISDKSGKTDSTMLIIVGVVALLLLAN